MQGPIVVKELFSPEIHSEIKDFVDDYAKYMPLARDENEFYRTYINDHWFFKHIHFQLADFASEQFKEKLKPSYCFLSLYHDGGSCPLHIDRPQCYRTIDYLIDQEESEPWPILISDSMSDQEVSVIHSSKRAHPETKKEISEIVDWMTWNEVLLQPNDATLYSGTNAWHYRPSKLNGSASLIFWHFVREDFDGPLQ